MKFVYTNQDQNYEINIYETKTYMYITHVINLENNDLFTLSQNPNKNRAIKIADRLLEMIDIATREGYIFNGESFNHPSGVTIPVSYALDLDVSISNFINTIQRELCNLSK